MKRGTLAYIRRFNKVTGLCARLSAIDPQLADVVMLFATRPPAKRRTLARKLLALGPDVARFVRVLEAVAS